MSVTLLTNSAGAKTASSTMSQANHKSAKANSKVKLVAAFMPASVLEIVQRGGDAAIKQAWRLLSQKACREATNSFLNRKLWEFDPLVGDNGCERRALKIYDLSSSTELQAELAVLNTSLEEIALDCLPKSQKKTPRFQELFERVQKIEMSLDAAYLLQAHFLASLKTIKRDEETHKIVYSNSGTGAEAEVNDLNRLLDFRKATSKDAVSAVVKHVQAQLKESSFGYIHDEASKIAKSMLANNEFAMLQEMTTPSTYRSFFGFKAILLKLRERQALFAVKQLVPTADSAKKAKEESAKSAETAPALTPTTLVYRSATSGGAFELVSDSDLRKFQKEAVYVLEGAVTPLNMDPAQLRDKFKASGGLEEVLLANASLIMEGPVEKTDAVANDVFTNYQANAKKMGYVKTLVKGEESLTNPFFLMDHAYCSVLEVIACQKK